MSKYFGIVIALGLLAYFVYQRMRRPKVTEAKSVPTGVRKMTYVIVLIMLLFGPFMLISAGQKLVIEGERQFAWAPASGFVTEHIQSGLRKGRPTYQTRFHYQTSSATGSVDHEVLDTSNDSQNPPAVSSPVKVLYNPSNPDEAMVDDFFSRWGISLILSAVGCFLLFWAGGAALQIIKLQSLQALERPSPQAGPGFGKLIQTKKNFFLSLKNRPSWRLIVEYQDPAGRKYTADSEPIWDYHPDTWAKTDLEVPLSIDRANPARAWVRVQDYFKACK